MHLDFQFNDIPLGICYALLLVVLLFQLYYIFFIYGRLARYKVVSHKDNTDLPPVSVIICASNEQENLTNFLKSILEQDYPQFETIVVNDNSTDDTQWILQQFKSQYPNLHIVEIKEHLRIKNLKKFALTLGIKAAKNNLLVMTDADCQPNSEFWLREMAGAYTQDTEITLGYSPYFKEKGFLNKVIRFETTHTAMSYLSYALQKDPYMGVGRNLSYYKTLFFKGKGFNAHMHIKSGDDDLFVNQNSTKSNVNIAIHPDAHVYSVPKTTWKSYYKQKGRHAGASVLYKKRHKWMLATQLITSILFYLLLTINLILFTQYWFIAVTIYFIRYISQLLVFNSIFNKLAVKDLLIWLPILDVFFYFYICINGLFNRKRKVKSWK